MLYVIYKGIIIGILVSAPMGPVGLLCIQKTLCKGRWHGFLSGLGAAFSDFLYAVIACTCMGILIVFIEKNRVFLQIVGSILLVIFGIYTFLKNSSRNLKKIEKTIKPCSYSQSILTVFLLAFSNPFIIFLYMGLFNSFNLLLAKEELCIKVLGLFCIFVGNLLWWFVVTFLVAKLRKIFNARGLYIMNIIIGIIIILLAFWLVFYTFTTLD